MLGAVRTFLNAADIVSTAVHIEFTFLRSQFTSCKLPSKNSAFAGTSFESGRAQEIRRSRHWSGQGGIESARCTVNHRRSSNRCNAFSQRSDREWIILDKRIGTLICRGVKLPRFLSRSSLWLALAAGTLAGSGYALAESPSSSVDTRIGTANGGNTYPGATVPFGMVQWSPDTDNGFYLYKDRLIQGFSLTHLSGAGCPVFADMPILPWSGRPAPSRPDPGLETVGFAHRSEVAEPGYYAVTLSDGTRVELTASDRSGIARLTYPKGRRAGLLVNGRGSASTDVHMKFLPPVARERDGQRLAINEDGTLTGTVTAGGFCGSPTRYTLFVAYQMKNRPRQSLLWQDGALKPKSTRVSGKRAVAWFDLGRNRSQIVKVGVSYVSAEKARANLASEIPGWDFDDMRKHAKDRWSAALGKIEIRGASDTDRRIFYTGLYHMLVGQTLFSDFDGEYMGFDEKPHRLAAGQKGQYTNISDWDIYRNTVQMQALLFPQEASDLAQSLVNDAEQLGSFPRWATANDGSYVMGGDSPPIILSSIYAFGATGFDAKSGLQFMRKSAAQPGLGQHGRTERDDLADYLRLGYISSANSLSASETLEFANADFASAQLAKAIGDDASHDLLLKHAGNWRNLLDPDTRWIRPRNSDGSWLAGFDAEKSLPHRPNASVPTDQTGFEEGNTYQYTFMLPFDYQGLFNAIGDDAVVEQRLDRFFHKLVCWGEPCFNMANEPDFVTPYAYTFLGKPWKTADVVARIENQTFNATPGGIPGNDDLGATSGVYIWNALGMYPAIPGLGGVVLGRPRFEHAVLCLGHGGTLTINKRGSGRYVGAVTVNGKPYPGTWLDLTGKFRDSIEINFDMQTEAGSPWGAARENRPPSLNEAKTR